MDINKTLKHNKIKKLDFARFCKLKNGDSLNCRIRKRPDWVENDLKLYLLQKLGINIDELLKNLIK